MKKRVHIEMKMLSFSGEGDASTFGQLLEEFQSSVRESLRTGTDVDKTVIIGGGQAHIKIKPRDR